jgi:hypothetical protein
VRRAGYHCRCLSAWRAPPSCHRKTGTHPRGSHPPEPPSGASYAVQPDTDLTSSVFISHLSPAHVRTHPKHESLQLAELRSHQRRPPCPPCHGRRSAIAPMCILVKVVWQLGAVRFDPSSAHQDHHMRAAHGQNSPYTCQNCEV